MRKYGTDATQEFAERLREALELRNGGNQSELARYVGCTPQAASKWLQGMQFPRDHVLPKVAEFLNVTPEYLKFGGPKPEPKRPEWLLVYVSIEEADALTQMRELSETGHRQLKAALISAERLPAEALPRKSDRH